MGDEMDGQNEIEWKTRYQVIVDEYYDSPEEAQDIADKIGIFANVATDVEEVELSY